MDETRKIPRFGLFAVMCVSGVYSAMMFSPFVSGGSSLADLSLSQAVVFVISLILIRVVTSREISDTAKKAVGIFSLYVCAVLLSELTLFLSSFTHVSFRMASYIALVTAAALFAARRGINSVCRSAVLFFMINGVIGVIGFVLLLMRVRTENFVHSQGSVRFCPAAFGELFALPVMYLMRDDTQSGEKRPLVFFSAVTALFAAAMSAVSLGALGEYSSAVRFPLYTAAQTVGIGTFQRLDVLFLCARMIGLFTALSFHFAAAEKAAGKTVQTVGACAVLGTVFLSLASSPFRDLLLDGRIAAVLLMSAVLFPAFRRQRRTAAVLAACVMLSGCSKVQLEDRLIIKGIGIDDEDGVVRLTVQYLDSYSDGDRQENRVVSTNGRTISDAVGKLKDSTGSEPFLGQNAVVIFGKNSVSRLETSLDYLASYSESRPTARVYLADNTAEEILTFEKDGALTAADRIVGISPSSAPYDNLFTVMSLKNAVSDETVTPVMAVIHIWDNDIRLKTAACIVGGEVTELNEDEYLTFCLLRGLDSEAVITKDDLSCEVDRCKTDISGFISGGRMYVKVKIRPVVSVLEQERERTQTEISELLSGELTELFEKSVRSVTIDRGIDFCGLDRAFRGSERSEFYRLLQSAAVDIDTNVRVSQAKALR